MKFDLVFRRYKLKVKFSNMGLIKNSHECLFYLFLHQRSYSQSVAICQKYIKYNLIFWRIVNLNLDCFLHSKFTMIKKKTSNEIKLYLKRHCISFDHFTSQTFSFQHFQCLITNTTKPMLCCWVNWQSYHGEFTFHFPSQFWSYTCRNVWGCVWLDLINILTVDQ